MTDLRRDPITKRWVIVASDRTKRPTDNVKKEMKKKEDAKQESPTSCPFCLGNEGSTPPEIWVDPYRTPPNSPGWQIRVVPNRFKAVGIDDPLKTQPLGMYLTMVGYGAHEVIIESPNHGVFFEDQPLEHMMRIIGCFRARVSDLYKDPKMKQILIFKNHGLEAGASLTHPHSQLMTLPIVPIHQKEELSGAREYFKKERSCIWCDIMTQEMRMNIEIYNEAGEKIKADLPKERLVYENQSFMAHCPFASRFPYETHFIPKRHSHFFGNIGEKENFNEVRDFAEILKTVIKRLNAVLKDKCSNGVPFNFAIHSSPNLNFRENGDEFKTIREDFHWHLELYPVLSTMAGFEKGSGFYINIVPPEVAAYHLRLAEIL